MKVGLPEVGFREVAFHRLACLKSNFSRVCAAKIQIVQTFGKFVIFFELLIVGLLELPVFQ